MKHEIKIGIEAPSREDAIDIASDLVELKNLLNNKELKDLKKVIKKNPGIVQQAKQFLGIE